jgi:hypothetical protein
VPARILEFEVRFKKREGSLRNRVEKLGLDSSGSG